MRDDGSVSGWAPRAPDFLDQRGGALLEDALG